MQSTRQPGISRRATLALMGAGAVTIAAPWVARAQAKTAAKRGVHKRGRDDRG